MIKLRMRNLKIHSKKYNKTIKIIQKKIFQVTIKRKIKPKNKIKTNPLTKFKIKKCKKKIKIHQSQFQTQLIEVTL